MNLSLDHLTEAEKRRYADGEWLAAHPVPSVKLNRERRGKRSPEVDVAELSARIRVELENR